MLICDRSRKTADGWVSFPSLDTLAKDSRLNRRTVIRIVQFLEASGFITVTRKKFMSNVYQLVTTALGFTRDTLNFARKLIKTAYARKPAPATATTKTRATVTAIAGGLYQIKGRWFSKKQAEALHTLNFAEGVCLG